MKKYLFRDEHKSNNYYYTEDDFGLCKGVLKQIGVTSKRFQLFVRKTKAPNFLPVVYDNELNEYIVKYKGKDVPFRLSYHEQCEATQFGNKFYIRAVSW